MFILRSEASFDAAHYLSGYVGKCSNIHGHRYTLITKVFSENLHEEGQLRGMVDDFGNIKAIIKDIAELFDHKLLLEDNLEGRTLAEGLKVLPNDFKIIFLPFRTTAEELSRHIFNTLKDRGLKVYEVELFETPTNSCIYREG